MPGRARRPARIAADTRMEEADAPSALSLERPAKQGYLWKQSQWVKKWKKRWFVLWPNAPHRDKGRMLFYYLTPQDKRPRGVIALAPGSFTLMTSPGRTVKDRDFPLCLMIKLQGKRNDDLELATDNETEVMSWAHAINSTGAINESVPNPGGADTIFSSAQLRDQLTRDSDEEDGDLGGARARTGGAAAHSGDDKMDLIIELDQVSSERDQLQKHQEVLQKALQMFLPTADLSSSGQLLEQADHAASNRTEVSRLQQDLGHAQRRAAEIERVREAEQARQRRDEQRLHDELQELRSQNSTLRGDEQLCREEVVALREEITRLRQSSAAAGAGAGGTGSIDATGDNRTSEASEEGTGGSAETSVGSSGNGSGEASVGMQGPQQAVLDAELRQLRLDHQQALADAEQRMLEEQEEHSVEKRRLEEMLTKTAKKNRELRSKLESSDSSASSHSERMKELTDENRALMKAKNDSTVEAASTRKELERANEEIEKQDKQISDLQAEKGGNSDQLNVMTQQVAKLTQEKDSATAELEAALDNVGELSTRLDETLAELAQLKAQQPKASGAGNANAAQHGGTEAARVAQLEAALREAEARRAQVEAARLDLETKVRQALLTAKANQDRLEAENASLKAQLDLQNGSSNA